VLASIDNGLAQLRRADPDAAADVDLLRRKPVDRASVVVVGETKRGKSSLINAVIGIPGLSPVDAAVATSSFLEFRSGQEPAARAHVPGLTDPVPLELAALRDWGTVLGTLPDGVRPPRQITIEYPAPFLAELTLVDTPGVGGLDPAHAEIALDAAEHATALLFVVDASAPFSRPELDFLVAASKRVNLVLFALTKTDAYPGWRTVLDDDRALLRAHAPRFAGAEFFPVSAMLAELAETLPPEAAGELVTESRIEPLREILTHQVAARSGLLRQANVLRTVRSELVRLDLAVTDRIRTADPDPAALQKLKDERAAIAAKKRTDTRSWQLSMNAETRRARTDATARLRLEVSEQQERWLNVIEKASREELTGLPHNVDRSLQAMSLRLSAELDRRFRSVGETVLREVFGPAELDLALSGLASRLATEIRSRPRREGGPDNLLVVTSSASSAFFAGRIVAGSSVLGFVAAPLGIGIGLAAGAYLLYRRRVHNDRQQARLWLREILAETRASVGDELAHRFTDAEYALNLALDEAVERRLAQLDQKIAGIDRAMAEDRSTRQLNKAKAQSEREQLRAGIKQLDETLVKVRQAIRPSVPSAV
jgi:hypothetical protein